MLKKTIILFAISSIFAQTTGKLSGTILDSNKSPILGAIVSVDGTSLGTVTDPDGFYYMINISPGTYSLKVSMIGYKTVIVEDVIISVNKTTRINVELDQGYVEGEEVLVTASKISVKKDQAGTIKNISEKQIEILPVKDVASIVSMQAGVVDGHFRGGRKTEVTYLIDGMKAEDAFGMDSNNKFSLEPSVLRDLEIITGTFNAEYGRAMSGTVNQITKDGGDEFETTFSSKYENYFSSNSKIFPGIDNFEKNLNQDYNFQISGPILKEKIFFFLNYRYQNNLGHLNGYDFFNVSDQSDFSADNSANYYSEHSGSHVIETYCSNYQGGEIFNPGTSDQITDASECSLYGDCEVIFSGCYDENGIFISNSANGSCIENTELQTNSLIIKSNSQFSITENTCSDYEYINQIIEAQFTNYEVSLLESDVFLTTRFIPAQIRNKNDNFIPMNNSISSSILGKLTFKPLPYLKISLMNSTNEYEGDWYSHFYKYSPDSRSTNYSNKNFSSLFVNYMFNTSAFMDFKLSRNSQEDNSYIFKNPNDIRYIADGYYRNESGFLQGGQDKVHNTKIIEDINVKFDFNWQVNSTHNIKSGLDKITHNVDIANFTIRDSSSTDEVYTPYIDKGVRSSFSEEYKVKCLEYSAYIQDKMEFDEMVINFGLRYDMFDPNTYYPSDYRNPGNDLINVNQSTSLKTKTKDQISPRFALSYQVGAGALLRFSYGHFFQMPPLYAMYSNSDWLISPNNYQTILGNPNLEAEKTVNYEFGYWQEINKSMSFELVVFNKDIYNLLTTRTITTYNTVKYGLYTNKDYGNARGLELIYDYQSGPFTLLANYTFQYTKGIADSPTTSFSREGTNQDPITSLIPLSWDQRHTLNLTFGYNKENYGATISAYFNSGTAFTFEPISENSLANINLLPNNAYKPSNTLINLSSYYNIPKIKDVKLRITLEIYNLFDSLNEYQVNSQTGRAYSAILTDSDQVSFKNNYTSIEDTYQDPSQYGAPRSIKLGISIKY